MAFCHIYARRDGMFRVRMSGRDRDPRFGVATFTSQLFDEEAAARRWIDLGRRTRGLDDMPVPRVIRRGSGI